MTSPRSYRGLHILAGEAEDEEGVDELFAGDLAEAEDLLHGAQRARVHCRRVTRDRSRHVTGQPIQGGTGNIGTAQLRSQIGKRNCGENVKYMASVGCQVFNYVKDEHRLVF